MTDTLPLKIDGKKLRGPRKKPAGRTRPTWSDYSPKTSVDCDHCVEVAYESAMAGEPFDGLRKARRKRRQDGQNLHLCHEHARIQKESDDDEYGDVASTANTRRRYIS